MGDAGVLVLMLCRGAARWWHAGRVVAGDRARLLQVVTAAGLAAPPGGDGVIPAARVGPMRLTFAVRAAGRRPAAPVGDGRESMDDARVMVLSLRQNAVWWWRTERVDVNYPAYAAYDLDEGGGAEGLNAPPGEGGAMPAAVAGRVALTFAAEAPSRREELTDAERLAVAVLTGDRRAALLLADMVLLGEAAVSG